MMDNHKDRLDIIDSMRERWKRKIHPSVVALESYVEGFADAKELAYDNTWDIVAKWVHNFLGTKPDAHQLRWTDCIAEFSPTEECQIAVFFAALDAGRGVQYEQISTFCPTQQWRDDFNQRQEQFFAGDCQRIIPTPSRIEIARSMDGCWRLFYFDKHGFRYYEVRQESENALKSWAESCLNIPKEFWRKT